MEWSQALVSDLPGYGRSLVARQRLPAAQPLLQVRRSLDPNLSHHHTHTYL